MAFDLAFDSGQEAVADLVSRFFTRECPVAAVRAAEPLGFSAELWQRFCELGLAGMGVAEAAGGDGASMRDLVLVAEAAGAALAPVPFVEHTVATRRFPDPRLITGEAIATIALHPAVDGRWRLVPAGAIAEVVLGVDGDDFVAVTAEPPGSAPRNHGDSPLADRSTAGDRVRLGDASELAAVLVEWKVLVAALLGGLAARALAIGTAYAKERRQFGRPIGAFQAVQHGLAECVGPVEGTRLLARKAAWALDTGPDGEVAVTEGDVDDPAVLASMAFAFATEAATTTTKRALQYHGAYGFSTEYDIQLYYRRARGWPLAFRGAKSERQHLADLCWPGTGN